MIEKINSRTGGVDFMMAMGFDVQEEEVDGQVDRVYILTHEEMEGVQSAVEWLGYVIVLLFVDSQD